MFEYALHKAKQLGTFVSGRGAVAAGVGGTVATGGISAVTGAMIALPLGAGIMAVLSHQEHEYHERDLLNFYREEIAAQTGKSRKLVTTQDLRSVAEGDESRGIAGNPALKEALDKNDTSQRLSFLIHGAAAVTTLALVGTAAVVGLGLPSLVLGAGAMMFCTLADEMAQHFAFKAAGLDKATEDDRVRGLESELRHRGTVSKERVFGVMLAANPALEKQIEQQTGMGYGELSPLAQQMLVKQYGGAGLNDLTHNLNLGRVRPQEVAFAAYGQQSGVEPKVSSYDALRERVMEKAHVLWEQGKHKAGDALHHGKEKASEALHYGSEKLHHAADRLKLAFHRPKTTMGSPVATQEIQFDSHPPAADSPTPSFAARFAPKPAQGFVEQLQNEQTNPQPSPAR